MSSILRPLLLRLAEDGWFRPLWSERIGEEWRRNAARIWRTSAQALDDEWASMARRFPTACQSDLQAYEAGLRYSDPKDWHVVAAGLAGRARLLEPYTPEVRVLTWNLKDFDKAELKRQALTAWDPDRQFVQWWTRQPARMRATLPDVGTHAQALGRSEPVAETLKRERLFRTARLFDQA